eukprot:5285444-Alexandrium_andersonii.AAC.1
MNAHGSESYMLFATEPLDGKPARSLVEELEAMTEDQVRHLPVPVAEMKSYAELQAMLEGLQECQTEG